MMENDHQGRHTLHIDDPSRFNAMQLCVQPGEGSRVTDILLDEAYAGRYQMTYEPTEEGNYNVVVYSLDGRTFTNGGTAMLRIETESDEGEVNVGDILLVTKELQTVGIGNVTRVAPTYATGSDDETPAYNLAGQQVTPGYKGLVIKKGKALLTR